MRFSADYWKQHLRLTTHVEGGSFREIYRSPLIALSGNLPGIFKGDKHFSTSIYFLLEKNQFSAFHKIASDEVWHFYTGDALCVYEIDLNGNLTEHLIGNNPEAGESFQCVIKAGNWFASKIKSGGEYTLVGCTVSPGFDFADFELADRASLINQYPQHKTLITQLSYDR